jgi:hypothetical protein
MLNARSIAIATALALVACHRLTSDERKLIGTWGIGSVSADWRITFKPDHTLILAEEDPAGSHKFPDALVGTWRLADSELTIDVDMTKVEATLHEKSPPHVHTEKITFASDNEIECAGHYPYIRIK